ncbi:MAG: UvrD-helicase domain-containing protein [Verrucomicrobiota bacterium]|nr:UvrD-helicase domain-containing protein [Verrucomicrobiota bacterium]
MKRSLRENVQKCCERLQLGYWGNGTRVKLLKGCPRLVYEARVNRSLRLLFTVASLPATKPPHQKEFFLFLWDIVDHDAIDRASRMNVQPETGFLDFEELSSMELEHAPEHPDASVLLPDDNATKETLEHLLTDPAPAILDSDDASESIRWFEFSADVVTDDAEWQALFDNADIKELELKLSAEQAVTVNAPGPVLLRGTAGSGKTTVSIFRLARLCIEHPQDRILYATYSEPLLASGKSLFKDLHQVRRLKPPKNQIDFLTFPELYQKLSGKPGRERGNLMRFPKFEGWYRQNELGDDASFAWEEIRGIIKGGCRNVQQSYLTAKEYEYLGRKRAPLFASERPRLYKIFQRYQEWCTNTNHYDDIDLAREALRTVSARKGGPIYQHVFCDEGQDLTELEILLLIKLCSNAANLFFTGDPQQIVNPSGFRWAEIRSILRESDPRTGVIEVLSLTRNFRSVRGIVALANALLRLQRERTGRMDDDEFQETRLQGATPVVVTGDPAHLIERLQDFGPHCAVITLRDTTAQRLRKQLNSERVFSVTDSKGLEFDACVLWDVIGQDLALWKTLLLDPATSMKENAAARRAIHHAYVAVTRTRRHLGIFESNPEAAELWRAPMFRAMVEMDSAEGLQKFMVCAANPATWEKEGDFFMERGRYSQAAECFRRAGNRTREKESLACFFESVGDYAKAAKLFLECGNKLKAANCFASGAQWTTAAELYYELRLWRKALVCIKKIEEPLKVAELWKKLNQPRRSDLAMLAHYVKQGRWDKAAKLSAQLGKLMDGAKYYEKIGRNRESRELMVKMSIQNKHYELAGKILILLGRYDDAREQFLRLGEQGKRGVRCCEGFELEREGRMQEAYDIFVEIEEYEKAGPIGIKLARATGDWEKIVMACEIAEDWKQAVTVLFPIKTSAKAKRWHEAYMAIFKENYGEAALIFEELGRDVMVFQMYKVCDLLDIVEKVKTEPTDELCADMMKLMSAVDRANLRRLHREGKLGSFLNRTGMRYYERDEVTYKLARQLAEECMCWKALAYNYRRHKEYDKARTYFEKAGLWKRVLLLDCRTAAMENRWEDAARHLIALGMPRKANSYLSYHHKLLGNIALSAEYFKKSGRQVKTDS